MTELPFVRPGQLRCAVCRKTTPAGRLTVQGSLRMCAACATPKVIHENEILRRLLSGEEPTAAMGEPRRWFPC